MQNRPYEMNSLAVIFYDRKKSVFKIDVDCQASFNDLKLIIECQFGVPAKELKIEYQGEQFAGSVRLQSDVVDVFKDSNIGCTIHFRMRELALIRKYSRGLAQGQRDLNCGLSILPDEILTQIAAEAGKKGPLHFNHQKRFAFACRFFGKPVKNPAMLAPSLEQQTSTTLRCLAK